MGKHGVMVGAAMRSEATAAAEHKGKMIMNDPFAMRPFFGYNFGHYLSHWLSMESRTQKALHKIFHVNWFRKNEAGKFIWPGFGLDFGQSQRRRRCYRECCWSHSFQWILKHPR